jgi:hypothetical protein
MKKVPSLRTAEESAPKSYPNRKSKRTMSTAALRRAIFSHFLCKYYIPHAKKSDIAKDDRLFGK